VVGVSVGGGVAEAPPVPVPVDAAAGSATAAVSAAAVSAADVALSRFICDVNRRRRGELTGSELESPYKRGNALDSPPPCRPRGLRGNGSPVPRDRPLCLGGEEYSEGRRIRVPRAFYRGWFEHPVNGVGSFPAQL
jgi:hypothetical protein